MISTKEIENMEFGFVKGKKYTINSTKRRSESHASLRKAVYIGEGGCGNAFLMFKAVDSDRIECFLKVDIVIGEYMIRDPERRKQKSLKGDKNYG